MHSDAAKWDDRYRSGEIPWDTGRASSELQRVVAEDGIAPCRALDLGCGTGNNSLWLAAQGFEVVGLDLAPRAVEIARGRMIAAGHTGRMLVGDVASPPDLGPSFGFLFDRGCWHAVRRSDPDIYLRTIPPLLASGAWGLILAGNDREPHEDGPPTVGEEVIRRELGSVFRIVRLREFRFDSPPGRQESFLAWSILVEKR